MRARCDPSAVPLLDAHVALGPDISEMPPASDVASAVRGLIPFPVRTIEPRVVAEGARSSILLPLEPSTRLTDLQRRLGSTGFEPHVVVVQGVDHDGIERSLREVQGWRLNFFWTVRDVDVVGLENETIWRSLGVFRFSRP